MKKNENYYIAQVLFENGHKSIIALDTCYIDEELVISTLQSWSRAFIGVELKVLSLCPCDFCDYIGVTTKISW
jgi:hypothetical protein